MYFGIDLIRKKKKAVHLLESSSTETEIGFPALLNGALLEQEEGAVSPAVDSLNVNHFGASTLFESSPNTVTYYLAFSYWAFPVLKVLLRKNKPINIRSSSLIL